MAILGESFDDYVREQIKTRQNKLALSTSSYDNDFLKYTHSRTSFLRLTSGVDVTESTIIQNLDLSGAGVTLNVGSGLADYMVISNANFGKFGLTKGLGDTNPSYGFLTNTNYGYSPPPGILSADVRSLNRGSLREATVNLICHNLNQFQVIDTLFLKLRYSFLLEWGHTTYFDNSNQLVTPANVKNLSKDFLNWNKDQYALLDKIETTRSDSNGNYDAFFGVIKNFSWELLPNGSYNITIVGISQGDVIESLKLNSNVTPNTTTEGTGTNSKYKTSTLTRILGEIKTQSAPINMIDGYQNGKPYWLASEKIADSLSLKTNFLKPDDKQNATSANSSLATGEAGYLLFYDLYPNSPDGNEYWPYYIKLGALLRIIEAFLLTYDKEKSNAPSFKINYAFDDSDNRCLTIPNHIAIDPRICVIPLKFDTKKLAAAIGDNDATTNTFTANYVNGTWVAPAGGVNSSSDETTYGIPDSEIESKGHKVPTANTTGQARPTPYYLSGSSIVLEQKADSAGALPSKSVSITINNPEQFSKGIAGLEQLLDPNPIQALEGGSTAVAVFTGDTPSGTPINDVNRSYAQNYNPTNNSFQAVLSGSSQDALAQQSAFPGITFNNWGGFTGTDSSGNTYFIVKTNGLNNYKTFAVLDLLTNTLKFGPGGQPYYEYTTNLKTVTVARTYYTKGSTAPLSDALATGGVLKYLDKGFITENNLVGNTMHMYIGIDHAVDLLNNNIDESGNISVYNFLTQLMKDVQRSLGNINDFEVICNDTNNTYTIIDNALIPHISKPKPDNIAKFNVNVLQNNKGNGGSFVTNFNLKTELFARVANAIAIGSQANGTTLQSNSSTFSYINKGIKDRILTTKLNTNQTNSTDVFEKAYTKAYDKFANFVLKYLGIKDGKGNGSLLTPEDIQEANSSLVDLFNYDLGIYSKKEFTGTGFIPLNLQLTMDGLSGIKIYQVFNINEELLPLMYKNKIRFIIKGVNHRISDKGWETNIETLSIPRKDDASGNPQPGRLNVQTLSGGSRSTSTAPPGSMNADLLRAELKLYSGKYTEKGNELSSSGNDILPGALDAAKKFLAELNTAHPSYKITFTAGNDTFHSGKDSPHNQGKAFDIVITGVQSHITPAKYDKNDVLIAPAKANPSLYTSEEKQKINNIIEILKKYFKVLDEYIEPSKYATGGHIHFNI